MARGRYGPEFSRSDIEAMLQDPEVVRFSTRLAFSAEALRPGEFGHAEPSTLGPKGGFTLWLHPALEESVELLPLLVGYHIPSINYLDIAGPTEAELFGATLSGLEGEEYYTRLCQLVDGLPGPGAPELTEEVARLLEPPASSPSSCGGGGGGCGCEH